MRLFRQAGTPGGRGTWKGLACLVGLGLVLPVSGQSQRATWVEPVRVTAEVVPMPARFGPLVATMIDAGTPSPFGAGSATAGLGLSSPATSGTATGSSATISVSATPLTEGSAVPGSTPGQPAPTSPDRFDLPPLLEPTGTNGVVQDYLVAALGDAAGLQAGPALLSAGAGAPALTRAMIRVHDGHSGRSVVMVSREGVGDGRLVITVVFH